MSTTVLQPIGVSGERIYYDGAKPILFRLLEQANLNVSELLKVLAKTSAVIYGELPWHATYLYLESKIAPIVNIEPTLAPVVSQIEFLILDDPDLFYDPTEVLYPVFETAGYRLMDQVLSNSIAHLEAPPVYNWTKHVDIFYHEHDVENLSETEFDWSDTLHHTRRYYPILIVYVAHSSRFEALPTRSLDATLQLYTRQQLRSEAHTVWAPYDLLINDVFCDSNKIEYDALPGSRRLRVDNLLSSMIDFGTQLVVYTGSELYSLGEFARIASVRKTATSHFFIEPLFGWYHALALHENRYGNDLHKMEDIDNIRDALFDSLETFYSRCVSEISAGEDESCMKFLRKHLIQTLFILRGRAFSRFLLSVGAINTGGSIGIIEDESVLPALSENVYVPLAVVAKEIFVEVEAKSYARQLPLNLNFVVEEELQEGEEQQPQPEEFESLSEEAPRMTYVTAQELEQLAHHNTYLAWNQFHYPSGWQFAPLTAESITEQDYNHLMQTGDCIDFIELGEVPVAISSYIEQDSENNIVILPSRLSGSTSPFGANAVCYTRAVLQAALHDPTSINLPCVGDNLRNFPADAAIRFVRVSIPNNVYVPETEIQSIADGSNSATIYQAEPSELELPTSASVDSIVNNRFTSGDHCQEGSDKQIYHLRPIVVAQAAAPATEDVGSPEGLMEDSLICNTQPTAQWLRNAQGRLIHCRDIQSAVVTQQSSPYEQQPPTRRRLR